MGTVLVITVVTGIVMLAVSRHAHAAQSSSTQHNGIARDGVVASVKTVHHDTSHDSWITYDYQVTLDEPVADVSTTTAHDPTEDFQRYTAGEKVSVLVDPDDHGYAELPGRPVQSSTWYVAPLVLGQLFVGLVVLMVARGRAIRRRPAPGSDVSAEAHPS